MTTFRKFFKLPTTHYKCVTRRHTGIVCKSGRLAECMGTNIKSSRDIYKVTCCTCLRNVCAGDYFAFKHSPILAAKAGVQLEKVNQKAYRNWFMQSKAMKLQLATGVVVPNKQLTKTP